MQKTKLDKKVTTKKWYKQRWGKITIIVSAIVILFVLALINGNHQYYKNLENNTQSNQNDSHPSTPTTSPSPTPTTKDSDTLNVNSTYNIDGITFINNEQKNFSACKFTLNQDYKYMSGKAYSVASAQHASLNFADFTKNDGTRFNVFQIKPKYLYATCYRESGSYGSADIFWD